jgi:iron complex transport system ATP-binding protein
MAHQFDVMDLLHRLNRERGNTIVLVVHDLNLAAWYVGYLIALRNRKVVATGVPEDVMTIETLRVLFDVETRILRHEVRQTLF